MDTLIERITAKKQNLCEFGGGIEAASIIITSSLMTFDLATLKFFEEPKSFFLFGSDRKLLALERRKAVTLHGFDRSPKVAARKSTVLQEIEVHEEFRVVLHFVCEGPHRLRIRRTFRAFDANGLRRSHLGDDARAALGGVRISIWTRLRTIHSLEEASRDRLGHRVSTAWPLLIRTPWRGCHRCHAGRMMS
ncbi:hypothetical protein MPTK2_4g19020 [Marchantia polymorpha subsp. ruderalis]